jgi:uncharacterized membrane protein
LKAWTRIIALALLAALALPLQLAAQTNATPLHPHQYHHYQISDMGTFGGPSAGLQAPFFPRTGVLNNHGTLVGFANTPAVDPYCGFGLLCSAGDASQLQNGVTTDLGKLSGGIDSQTNWISGNGLIAGLGDDGIPLPGFPIPRLHGLLWDHGIMTDLGTLPEGGNLVFPNGVNNRGEVVGAAQNLVPDPNTMFFPGYGTQSRAFYWKDGVMQDLGTLGTGTDATAALINERGQVVGWSYTNATPSAICAEAGFGFGFALTTSSFIWDQQNGMRDIGGLGGTCTIATDLNDRGQIVGLSALPGDLVMHPFVWDAATGMTDLLGASSALTNPFFGLTINEHGVVAGSAIDAGFTAFYPFLWQKVGGKWKQTNLEVNSVTTSINASGQVVGYGNVSFLWEDGGPAADLSTLVPPNSAVSRAEVNEINDRGEIAAQGWDASGNHHAVLLIPCDENHPSVEGCDYSVIDAETAAALVGPDSASRPAALTPGTRMPGMLNRLRSPKGRPAPGHAPAAVASLAISATPATADWLADRPLVPQYGSIAYCEISNGALTGACVQAVATNPCQSTFNGCPKGLPENGGSQINCPNGSQISISMIKCFSVPGFDLSASALTPATISPGASSTSTVSVSAYGGLGGSIAYTCSVQPTPLLAPTCSISPSSVRSGTPATLTVSTTAPTAALLPSAGSGLRYALWLPLFALVATGVGSRATRKDRKANLIAAALVCMLITGMAVQVGCGGSSAKPGTPPGSYTVTVMGTSGSVASSIAVSPLTVQ